MRLDSTSGFVKLAALAAGIVALVILAAGGGSPTQAATGGDCTVSATDVALDSEETKMLQLINDYRVQNGVPPLEVSYTLSRSAQWKSTDMAINNYYDHYDVPISRDMGQRFSDCGYDYQQSWRGENIHNVYYDNAQYVFGSWKGSASHNAAMLDTDYHAVGIGRAYAAGGQYWTADFGGYADGPVYRPPLANDNFPGAQAIGETPFTASPILTSDTFTVTREFPEPAPCGGTGGTVWYKFTPAADVLVQADTFGTDYDTVLAVYSGSGLSSLASVACNDDYGGLQSRVSFNAVAGVTYFTQIAGFRPPRSDADFQTIPQHVTFNLTCLSLSCPALTPSQSPSPTLVATPSPSPSPSPSSTPTPAAAAGPADVIDPITQPVDGATVPAGKTIKITATASAALGIAKVEFYVNGVRKCSDSSAPYSCNWGVPTPRGVTYTLEDRAYDTAGHTASSRITVVSGVDSTPPTISITSPAVGAGVGVNSTVTISASASDEVGVTKIEFYVNGSRKCSDGTAPFTCAWKVPSAPGVTYTLLAKAYDVAGNAATHSIGVTSQ